MPMSTNINASGGNDNFISLVSFCKNLGIIMTAENMVYVLSMAENVLSY